MAARISGVLSKIAKNLARPGIAGGAGAGAIVGGTSGGFTAIPNPAMIPFNIANTVAMAWSFGYFMVLGERYAYNVIHPEIMGKKLTIEEAAQKGVDMAYGFIGNNLDIVDMIMGESQGNIVEQGLPSSAGQVVGSIHLTQDDIQSMSDTLLKQAYSRGRGYFDDDTTQRIVNEMQKRGFLPAQVLETQKLNALQAAAIATSSAYANATYDQKIIGKGLNVQQLQDAINNYSELIKGQQAIIAGGNRYQVNTTFLDRITLYRKLIVEYQKAISFIAANNLQVTP